MRNSTTPSTRASGRQTPPATPLLALLRELGTSARRDEFAALCGTSVNYLYQLGTCARTSCRPPLARRIAAATSAMHSRHGTPVLTAETVLTMCAACEVA